MNPDAPPIAKDAFEKAAQPGPAREPSAVNVALTKVPSGGEEGHVDVSALEEALDAEFPWRNQLVFQSRQPAAGELDAWAEAVRWLLEAIVSAKIDSEHDSRRFQVMLAALGFFDVSGAGLGVVLDRFAGTHVCASLASLLARAGFLADELNEDSKAFLEELAKQVRAGDFKRLQYAQRVVRPNFGAHIRTAVLLLWKLDAAQLVRILDQRDSFILSMMVCEVVDSETPLLALQVQNLTFKFLSMSWLERLNSAKSGVTAVDVLRDLLLQVAKTPHWKSWLSANYKCPENTGAQARGALAAAFVQLGEEQWRDFIEVVALSTSRGSAESLADILNQVAGNLGDEKTQPFWDAAFARWDAWDYGKSQENYYLSSPQVCSFDVPVAMYYARLPAQQRLAEEMRLQQEIADVEQQWFVSESQLCTERNRLASRLRLVRHGSALAAGGNEALPAPVCPDSEYAEVRYRYHNINETLMRIQRR